MQEVYLIKSDNDLYKIGFSKNVKQRLKQLKTANPNNLQIIETFPTLYASKVESFLHSLLRNKKVNGEWFSLEKDDVENFIEKCKLLEKNYIILKKNGNPFI